MKPRELRMGVDIFTFNDLLERITLYKYRKGISSQSTTKLYELDNDSLVILTNLGLGQVRKLTNLFEEFVGGQNDMIAQLGNYAGIFDPIPNNDQLYVATKAGQKKIRRAWRQQLQEYHKQQNQIVVFQ
jgi:hypothetical protein